MYETPGSRFNVPSLDFTLAYNFKRTFQFFVKVIFYLTQDNLQNSSFLSNKPGCKFVKLFAIIAARRVSSHGFKRVMQKSAQNIFKKVGTLLYVQNRRKFFVFHYFFCVFSKILQKFCRIAYSLDIYIFPNS